MGKGSWDMRSGTLPGRKKTFAEKAEDLAGWRNITFEVTMMYADVARSIQGNFIFLPSVRAGVPGKMK
jgi:hypothetical protein